MKGTLRAVLIGLGAAGVALGLTAFLIGFGGFVAMLATAIVGGAP